MVRGGKMIGYILFFGMAAGIVWAGFNRSKSENGMMADGLRAVLFFFAGIYFTASAIKLYLGEAQSTLSESFWDAEGITYLHYGIVFLAVSAAAFLVMKLLFASAGVLFLQIFDLLYVLAVLGMLLLSERIDNRAYCILYIGCLFATGVIFGLGVHRGSGQWKPAFCGAGEYWKYFVEALPFISIWVVMTGIYLPSELYLHNIEEFTGGILPFLGIMLTGSIAMIFLLDFVFVLFLPKRCFRIAYLVAAGIGCAGYLQQMVLNGPLDAMNGEAQSWSMPKMLLNSGIWLVILLAVVIGGSRKTSIRSLCRVACIYISLIQLVTLGWLLLTSDLKSERTHAAITTEGALELAQKENVLVFVLDNFDCSWFEELCEENEHILEPLADFTYYRNSTSQFAHTGDGIASLLTGAMWKEDAGSYYEYAYQNSDVYERLAAQGVDVEIYTDLGLLPKKLYQHMENYTEDAVQKYDAGKTYRTMLRTSLYKTMPFFLKKQYEYYTSDIKEMYYSEHVWSIDNDLLFYQDLMENGLQVSEEIKSAFRFYHMRGPHAPFYLTEDLKYEPTGRMSSRNAQGTGSLKIVYAYLEQLRALGKYEDATIIITADHGVGKIVDTEKTSGQPDQTSRPLLLVKLPDEQHTAMQTSEAPVTQAELVPTVLNAFGIAHTAYGRTFAEVPAGEQRQRIHIDDYYDRRIVYTIDGHAADLGSWKIAWAEY